MLTKMILVLGLAALILGQTPEIDTSDHRSTMLQMLGAMVEVRRGREDFRALAVFEAVRDSNDPLYIAPLIDLAFFARFAETSTDQAVFDALKALSGKDFHTGWDAYLEWASEQNIALPPHYDEFKSAFFIAFVDPEMARFFRAGVQENAAINMLELVWGGVLVDGIPSLVNPRHITPTEATAEGESPRFARFCNAEDCRYPAPDEWVFGVSINGDSRAYPLRILNWHEMFNDVFGMATLYDAPDGAALCGFRAPTPFIALGRSGADWVQISGQSAGCPANGWLETAAIEWLAGDPQSLPESGVLSDSAVRGRVAGRPVMLAYCTLCGSGVLYDTRLMLDGQPVDLVFGSTGLLMRSNKVMYDRQTLTAWNALTGTPAFGALAGQVARLERLPVVVTDWATWLDEHPETSVISLETGYQRNYTNGAAYGDYFNDPDFLMFPVWQQDTSAQGNKEVIFALDINGVQKAYPLELIIPQGVTNDTLADTNLVLITRAAPERAFVEPGGAAVRAYERGEHVFAPGAERGQVIDADGRVWRVTEDALIAPDGEEALPRLGGHLAFWFGWYAYYPQTLVYAVE